MQESTRWRSWTAAAACLLAASVCAPILSAQLLAATTVATSGHATAAMETPDARYVLVTVDTEKASGIEVFQWQGAKLKRVAWQPLGTENAQGILLVPHTRMLAVGLSNAGVAFLSLDDALAGKAAVTLLPQGETSGSGYLAVAPDGQFLFVANEYGGNGNVGVIALHPDAQGGLHPETVAHIPTRRTTPGIAISPDGRRVYTVSEVLSDDESRTLPGHANPLLQRAGCLQAAGRPAHVGGALFTIDVAKAEALTPAADEATAKQAIVSQVEAGCSPVREAVSADGARVYVTARGDDRVLVYDAKLLETAPERAFLQALPSGGKAPVGLALFGDGLLLVADSNRFAPRQPGSAAVIDLASGKLLQTLPTGEFPRNITLSQDGHTLLMTVFTGNQLIALRKK
jgi:DNA-binding beta-propeller fold protein YncE